MDYLDYLQFLIPLRWREMLLPSPSPTPECIWRSDRAGVEMIKCRTCGALAVVPQLEGKWGRHHSRQRCTHCTHESKLHSVRLNRFVVCTYCGARCHPHRDKARLTKGAAQVFVVPACWWCKKLRGSGPDLESWMNALPRDAVQRRFVPAVVAKLKTQVDPWYDTGAKIHGNW